MKTLEELRAAPKVPPEDQVVRYVGASNYDPGTCKIDGSAFERKDKDKDGVSITRLGILSPDPEVDRAAIREIFSSRMTMGKKAVFVELNVGEALEALKEFNQEVFVCEDELIADGAMLPNRAHALIVGFPFQGEAVGSLKSEIAGDKMRRVARWSFDAFAKGA